MRWKSAGRLVDANVHGPERSGAENHRPATRKYTDPVFPTRNRSLSVLLIHIRPVPATGWYHGSPSRAISSAGSVATSTAFARDRLPGRFALTSFQLSSSGSLAK